MIDKRKKAEGKERRQIAHRSTCARQSNMENMGREGRKGGKKERMYGQIGRRKGGRTNGQRNERMDRCKEANMSR
eukprot:9092415-Heterocapsa_arctica.AAC.1